MTLPESIFYVLIATAASLMLVLLWRRFRRRRGFPEFERRRSLLNPQQRALYQTLMQLVGRDSIVALRVNLSTLVIPPGEDDGYENHWKRVLREWVDFVICSPSSVCPVLAIKLETRSERRRRKLGGLDVLEDTLKSAKVPLLRIKSADSYDANEIMTRIRFALVNQKRNKDEELFITEEYSNAPPESRSTTGGMSGFKKRRSGLMSQLKRVRRAI